MVQRYTVCGAACVFAQFVFYRRELAVDLEVLRGDIGGRFVDQEGDEKTTCRDRLNCYDKVHEPLAQQLVVVDPAWAFLIAGLLPDETDLIEHQAEQQRERCRSYNVTNQASSQKK